MSDMNAMSAALSSATMMAVVESSMKITATDTVPAVAYSLRI